MIANSLKWHKEHGAEPPEMPQSIKQLQNCERGLGLRKEELLYESLLKHKICERDLGLRAKGLGKRNYCRENRV